MIELISYKTYILDMNMKYVLGMFIIFMNKAIIVIIIYSFLLFIIKFIYLLLLLHFHDNYEQTIY